jgi:hypothetical protein
VLNLFDLTHGNYQVRRILTLPDFPGTEVRFDVRVTAVEPGDWTTELEIDGRYDGPTDFVAAHGYRLAWTHEGDRLLERGSAVLERASGEFVVSEWSSTINADLRMLAKFPKRGEVVRVDISPFHVDGDEMSYEWQGRVEAQHAFPKAMTVRATRRA